MLSYAAWLRSTHFRLYPYCSVLLPCFDHATLVRINLELCFNMTVAQTNHVQDPQVAKTIYTNNKDKEKRLPRDDPRFHMTLMTQMTIKQIPQCHMVG